VTIDYNMEPFTNDSAKSHPATYNIQAQLLFATGPNFQHDVAVTDIITPNDAFEHRRVNPICSEAGPEIVIRNNGKTALSSATINYSTGGGEMHTYSWKREGTPLRILDTAHLVLPGIDLGSGPNTFTVTVDDPADEYPRNNSMTVSYTRPKSYANTVYLALVTDDYGDLSQYTTNGISYEVKDLEGNVLYYKDGFDDRKTYRDTFKLQDGCYQFIIHDDFTELGDGLLPIVGAKGSYVLKDSKNQTIISATSGSPNYLASFGPREITTFTVSSVSDVGQQSPRQKEEVKIFPNPTAGEFTIDLASLARTKPVTVQVYTLAGEEVYHRMVTGNDPTLVKLDLSGKPAGVYMVKIDTGEMVWGEKVVVAGK